MKTPIHVIFSKKTVPDKIVQTFNKAIDSLHRSGAYENIVCFIEDYTDPQLDKLFE